MRVVVTGAAGLTGAAVMRELVGRGHRVIGTTRRATALEGIRALGAEAVMADPANASSLRPAVERADALVHVAGILYGTSVAASGIDRLSRVVVVSTASVYSRSHRSADLYGRNERAVVDVRPDTLIARPTMIYGSRRDRNVHRVIAFAHRFRVLPLPDGGDALLQPIHYTDLAAAVASLVDSEATGVVDMGGLRPITLASAARTVFAALRLPPLLVPIPVSGAMPFARGLDRLAGTRWAERLDRTREDRTVDVARLVELTHVRLRPFEEGVGAEVAEMGLGLTG